jgi:hypothetical protein
MGALTPTKMVLMERRQIWRKRAFFDEKRALVPTQVLALTDFLDLFWRLTPTLQALH